jgi:hypothetical protein
MENILTRANYEPASTLTGLQAPRPRHWPLLLIVLVGIFLFTTTRRGQAWGDDFSMYIHHAKNLANGIAYGQTGYIINPHFPSIGPHTYPPVFPLLLAPVYKIWGLNLEALKLVGLAACLLALVLIYACFQGELPPGQLALLLALVGFSPHVWVLKDSVISDLPFLCFFYLSLFLIQTAYGRVAAFGRAAAHENLWALLVAGAVLLAYGTRSIGVMLLPSLVVYDVLRQRRIQPLTYKIFAVTVPLMALQNLLIHTDMGYGAQMTVTLANVLNNVRAYLSEFSVILTGNLPMLLRLGLLGVISLLVLWGWWQSVQRGITWFELLPLLYLPPILLISLEIQPRYLLPMLPLYFYYAWRGLNFRWLPKPLLNTAAAVLVLTLSVGYVRWYRQANFSPYNEGISKLETQQLAGFLRAQTAPQSVFVFIKPRLLALLTERQAAAWHMPENEAELWNFLRAIRATHLISGPADLSPERQAYLQQFILHHQDRLQELYANADYKVYRIQP